MRTIALALLELVARWEARCNSSDSIHGLQPPKHHRLLLPWGHRLLALPIIVLMLPLLSLLWWVTSPLHLQMAKWIKHPWAHMEPPAVSRPSHYLMAIQGYTWNFYGWRWRPSPSEGINEIHKPTCGKETESRRDLSAGEEFFMMRWMSTMLYSTLWRMGDANTHILHTDCLRWWDKGVACLYCLCKVMLGECTKVRRTCEAM